MYICTPYMLRTCSVHYMIPSRAPVATGEEGAARVPPEPTNSHWNRQSDLFVSQSDKSETGRHNRPARTACSSIAAGTNQRAGC